MPTHNNTRLSITHGLRAFAGSLLAGAFAAGMLSPASLLAPEVALVHAATTGAIADTGVQVEGCTLRCRYQAANLLSPALIIVEGSNPDALPKTLKLDATILVSEPLSAMSRVMRLPTASSVASCDLVLAPRSSGTVTLVLAADLPRTGTIQVQARQASRLRQSAPAVERLIQSGTLLQTITLNEPFAATVSAPSQLDLQLSLAIPSLVQTSSDPSLLVAWKPAWGIPLPVGPQ